MLQRDPLDEKIRALLREEAPPEIAPAKGHRARFLSKLEQQQRHKNQSRAIYRRFAVAAGLVLFVALGIFEYARYSPKTADLAGISPEMEQTQYFFTSTIENEWKNIEKQATPETNFLVEDALKQLQTLEEEYKNLQEDLVKSGNDKRVVYAMITNFQNRIQVLETVLEQLEQFNQLKSKNDATTL